MNEALLIHHQTHVILIRPGLEEHQITRFGMTAKWPRGRLLSGRNARDRHPSCLMRDQREAAAVKRLMGGCPTIDVRRSDLREGGNDHIRSLRLEPAQIEGLSSYFDGAAWLAGAAEHDRGQDKQHERASNQRGRPVHRARLERPYRKLIES